uniref:Uncharacterized protein n=1 Tax=Anguilla anguilla TaxID=7936 RepID=A0A0E9V0A2_ANGAN
MDATGFYWMRSTMLQNPIG